MSRDHVSHRGGRVGQVFWEIISSSLVRSDGFSTIYSGVMKSLKFKEGVQMNRCWCSVPSSNCFNNIKTNSDHIAAITKHVSVCI